MASFPYAFWGYWIRCRFKIILYRYVNINAATADAQTIIFYYDDHYHYFDCICFYSDWTFFLFFILFISHPSSQFLISLFKRNEKIIINTFFWIKKIHKQNDLRKWKKSRDPSYGLHIQKEEQNTIFAGPQCSVPSNTEYQVLNNIECDFGFIIIRPVREWNNTTYRDLCSFIVCIYLYFVLFYVIFHFHSGFWFPLLAYWNRTRARLLDSMLNRSVCGAWIWNVDIFDFVW